MIVRADKVARDAAIEACDGDAEYDVDTKRKECRRRMMVSLERRNEITKSWEGSGIGLTLEAVEVWCVGGKNLDCGR